MLRRRVTADKHAAVLASEAGAVDQSALNLADRSAVVTALRRLPARQREALVLRYYLDLPEADVAKAMGFTCGAVKSHTARGLAALRAILDDVAAPLS